MKKLSAIYRLWRVDVICLITILTFLLAISDSENIMVFFLTKLLAIFLVFIDIALSIHWNTMGYFKGINKLLDD